MIQHIDVIFENGILRPLVPLQLPEHMPMKVILDTNEELQEAETVKKQQTALRALFAEIDAMPQKQNNDDWSAADHDDLLYGRNA